MKVFLSLLHNPSGHTFPSSSLQGVYRRITIPFWSLCEVPLFTRIIKPILSSSIPNGSDQRKDLQKNKTQVLGMDKNILQPKTYRKMGKSTLVSKLDFSQCLWVKMTSTNPQFVNSNSENVYGNYKRKNDVPKPTNCESLLAIHSAITYGFLRM